MKNFFNTVKLHLCAILVALLHNGCTVQAQSVFPAFPPKDVTSKMDRDQMLLQMGLIPPTLPSKLKDPNASPDAFPQDSLNPEGNWTNAYGHTITRSGWGLWNNYHDKSSGFFPGPDSARLGSYTPIDLLKSKNGKKIITAYEWWNERRPEILKDVQEELYGLFPPDSILPEVTFSIKKTTGEKGNLAYIQKEITRTIDTSRYPEVRDVPVISCVLRIPATAIEPVPVLVVYAGFGNVLDRYWEITSPNGWGVCTFNPNALQPDNGVGLTSYLIGLVNKGNWRKPSDWGTIGAWSWGVSRLIDYLETDKDVDAKKIGLTGHSRYGKATLVCMGYEPRVAIGFPSDAGSLGTTMTRRHWGQDLENSTGENEYHWMAGNFFKYAGELVEGGYLPRKIENLPIDAHSLLALCAPRPMLHNGGTVSTWTDPYGQYLTTAYATPVYELLGKKGIIMRDDKPKINVGYIEGDLAYRYHEGGHTDAPEWPTFFEFASKYIKAPTFETSSDFINLGDKKNSFASITIKSNQDWNVIGSEKWLNIEKKDSSLIVTANENRGKAARSALLSINTKGHKKDIMIHQAAKKPSLNISVKELLIGDNETETASFGITSNTAWTISCSEDWLYAFPEGGINNNAVILKASTNPSVEKRVSTLTVSAPGVEPLKVTVTQKESPPTLNVFSQAVEIGAHEGSSAGFFVNSNAPWKIECSESWLIPEVDFGKGFGRVSIKAKKNENSSVRKAKVSVLVDGLPPHVLEVTQVGK